ncbi:MAG: hypothetical protein M3362_22000 [Acidobacteriota bacterium]|nr:hypothetical protein [Acidobacteriota bacterium]
MEDDAPATPAQVPTPSERKPNSTFTALAARAYASQATNGAKASEDNKNEEASPAGVEIASTAPRIVHRKNVASPTASTTSASTATQDAATGQRTQRGSDIERLRAELREVKFTLNAFTPRAFAADYSFNAPGVLGANGEIYDSPYYEAYLELAAAGLDPVLARRVIRAALSSTREPSGQPFEVACKVLKGALPSLVQFGDDPLASQTDAAPNSNAIALIGPTGVGKTTTLAKLAARAALRERRRVELITLDTYRIAAVEQLRTYAEIIGAGFHIPRSVLELDVLVRRFAGEAMVLVDTIGRSPNDLADQMELADYLRAQDDMLKCLVLQATTHPTDAQVAVRKFALFGANRLVITKLDETARPGAAISTAYDSALPLVYLCAGQRVPEDLERATPETFNARVLRRANAIAAAA